MEKSVKIEELLDRPGTYFNPQTEVLVVVDDSADLDSQIFNMEKFEGSEWVRISDEVPLDTETRDTLLQSFQTSYHAGLAGSLSLTAAEMDDNDDGEADDQEVGRE